MRTHSPENERIKRSYFLYLKEARRLSEHSIDAAAAALSRFEAYTKHRDFKGFHIQQGVGFKRKLADQLSSRTGQPLSSSTLFATLNALRAFFHWLAGQPGYRSHLTYADADYFSLSEKESRIAKTSFARPVPTTEQILHVVREMPSTTDIHLRNRALIAFTLLTGARDGALASLNLKHVDMEEGRLVQDAREVRTKFSKTITTWFFPVGDEIRQIVADWVGFLIKEKLFGPADPLFPATHVAIGQDNCFQADGLSRSGWSNATPIRKIFKEAFISAGLPYANPHSFRNTLAQLGEQVCRTPEEFKAWSQNLGHERVMTTFSSYGQVADARQRELMRGLARTPESAPDRERILSELWRVLETVK
ncbi:MAG TPA: tyrosine-type recombinase/integrase [Methyloceanibacter sp.]|jgi:integrase